MDSLSLAKAVFAHFGTLCYDRRLGWKLTLWDGSLEVIGDRRRLVEAAALRVSEFFENGKKRTAEARLLASNLMAQKDRWEASEYRSTDTIELINARAEILRLRAILGDLGVTADNVA